MTSRSSHTHAILLKGELKRKCTEGNIHLHYFTSAAYHMIYPLPLSYGRNKGSSPEANHEFNLPQISANIKASESYQKRKNKWKMNGTKNHLSDHVYCCLRELRAWANTSQSSYSHLICPVNLAWMKGQYLSAFSYILEETSSVFLSCVGYYVDKIC